jgi:hypothetical protein
VIIIELLKKQNEFIEKYNMFKNTLLVGYTTIGPDNKPVYHEVNEHVTVSMPSLPQVNTNLENL